MTTITIQKLDTPIRSGDWHDRPLCWEVVGPDQELQRFVTKKDAVTYRRCRKSAKSIGEASRMFLFA